MCMTLYMTLIVRDLTFTAQSIFKANSVEQFGVLPFWPNTKMTRLLFNTKLMK